MDKHKQIQIINKLLDQCGDCPLRYRQDGHPDKVHGHCALYHEMRKVGKPLWAEKHRDKYVKLVISSDEYMELRNIGFNDEEIAFEKGVSTSTIRRWKQKNGIRVGRSKYKSKIDKIDYEELVKEGLRPSQIQKRLGVSRGQLELFRHANGYKLDGLRKPLSSDKEILQAIIDKKSNWWIQKYLHAGAKRVNRIAREHGIAR
ncbi:hypothetical protein ACFP7A_00890 [Sporolactobacillus kofuensis]|uniref:Uncharacterized protein n=1 Tax=Sporolactobacillus kofuensis TaxID=269672 RepID=A0ABW1WCY8_9BACL|nr:hypothetical protein [Sporolactobacillus kofuensis]MCO7175541.1 hypothetical protein [Sporolactobacillus kofuensis]